MVSLTSNDGSPDTSSAPNCYALMWGDKQGKPENRILRLHAYAYYHTQPYRSTAIDKARGYGYFIHTNGQ